MYTRSGKFYEESQFYDEEKANVLWKILKGVDTFDQAFLKVLDNSCAIELHKNKFNHTKMIVLMKWSKNYEDLGKILYYFDSSLLCDPKISKLYAVMEKIKGKTYFFKDKIFLLLTKGLKTSKYLSDSVYKNIHTFLAKGKWTQNGKRKYISIYNLFYRTRFGLINMFFKGKVKRLPTEEEKNLISVLLTGIRKVGLDPSTKNKDYTQWRKQIGHYITKFILLKKELKKNPSKKQVIKILEDDFRVRLIF